MARKTRTVTKKEVRTYKEVTITCDFCGCRGIFVCHICGRDACGKHSSDHYENDRDYGDRYPPRWCKECESVYRRYESAIKTEEARHEEAMAGLENRWTAEALALAKEHLKKRKQNANIPNQA